MDLGGPQSNHQPPDVVLEKATTQNALIHLDSAANSQHAGVQLNAAVSGRLPRGTRTGISDTARACTRLHPRRLLCHALHSSIRPASWCTLAQIAFALAHALHPRTSSQDMLPGLDDIHGEELSEFAFGHSTAAMAVPNRPVESKPIARSMSAPDFVAEEWERFMHHKRCDPMSQLPPNRESQSAASSRHPSLCAQPWTLSQPATPFPPAPVYQQRWSSPTQLMPAMSSLTQSLGAQQAMLHHVAPGQGVHNGPQPRHDPRTVLDSNIRKLKRRGRKLYEELETIAVKLELLERARAEYGP